MENNRFGIEKIVRRYGLSYETDFKNCICKYQYYNDDITYRGIDYTTYGIRIDKKVYGRE